MAWKSKAEIEAANLADWEKETCIEIFEFEQNVAEIAAEIRAKAQKEGE